MIVNPITVVMIARNEEEKIGHALCHLAASLCPGTRLDLVVVNDQSTDATVAVANDFADQIAARDGYTARVVTTPHRLGTAAARNFGLAQTSRQQGVTVFLDGDVFIGPGTLEALSDTLHSHERCLVAGPTLVGLGTPGQDHYLQGRPVVLPSEDLAPENFADTCRKYGLGLLRGLRFPDYTLVPKPAPLRTLVTPHRVQALSGWCLAVKNDWLGMPFEGFDRNMAWPWSVGDDVELALRAYRRGGEVLVVPAGVATSSHELPPESTERRSPLFIHAAIRIAGLYFSLAVLAAVIGTYKEHPEFPAVAARTVISGDLARRRREIEAGAPPELHNLVTVLEEFGGFDAHVGPDFERSFWYGGNDSETAPQG